jgi:hypothetical protein
MQNILGSLETITAEGVFYQGMGGGKIAMIDVRDIADSAARVLLDRSHAGTTCTLTGPASIIWHTAAEAFSKALGQVGGGSDAGLQRRIRDTRPGRSSSSPGRSWLPPCPGNKARCSDGQPLTGQSAGFLCMVHGLNAVHARGRMG